MRKEAARAIIEAFSLPPPDVSKRALRAIANDRLAECMVLTDDQRRKLEPLVRDYQRARQHFGQDLQPRNLPFYELIKARYPGCNIIYEGGHQRMQAYFNGLAPTLLSYFLDLFPSDVVMPSAKQSLCHTQLPRPDLLQRCNEVFKKEGVIAPKNEHLRRFAQWLARGIAGDELTIVSPVCPDYTAEDLPDGRFRFTFQGLGGGTGVIARRLYRSLAALHTFFSEACGISSLSHWVCIGDFEGFSEATLHRLRISSSEFQAKINLSCEALLRDAPCHVTVCKFTELCAGEQGWRLRLDEMRHRMQSGDLCDALRNIDIADIAKARKPLYQRWHGAAEDDRDFRESLVLSQGMEYSTMGKIIVERFSNPLVLAADHYKLGPFYSLAASIPVIYLSHIYE